MPLHIILHGISNRTHHQRSCRRRNCVDAKSEGCDHYSKKLWNATSDERGPGLSSSTRTQIFFIV